MYHGAANDGRRPNAFQHAVWVAFMADSKPDHEGRLLAWHFAVLHEDHDYDRNDDEPESAEEKNIRFHSRMDMVNNRMGYGLAKTTALENHGVGFFCTQVRQKVRDKGVFIGKNNNPYRWKETVPASQRPVYRYKLDIYGTSTTLNAIHCDLGLEMFQAGDPLGIGGETDGS
jgi:hypothetical protein